MDLIPNRFLFRVAYPCRHVTGVPRDGDDLLDLPDDCRIDNFTDMDGRRDFADVRLAWNDEGIALQVEVRGKEKPPVGDAAKPRHSDGVSFWIDTRDARTGHRASRYCHQFHFLAGRRRAGTGRPGVRADEDQSSGSGCAAAPAGSVPFQFLAVRAAGAWRRSCLRSS